VKNEFGRNTSGEKVNCGGKYYASSARLLVKRLGLSF
jgi:hypothetical protein